MPYKRKRKIVSSLCERMSNFHVYCYIAKKSDQAAVKC